MENSWQSKCGSTLQSSMQYMASSSSQEPRTQMEMNSGRHLYPHVVQNCRPIHGQIEELVLPGIPNLSTDRLVHTEMGNSFLALLSGSPSLLQCDFQELLNSKSFSASSKLPTDGSVVAVSTVGSGVQLTSNGLLSETLSNQNTQNGAKLTPVFTSRTLVTPHCPSFSITHHDLQSVNLSLQSLEVAKAVLHQTVSSNENVKNLSSLKGEWCSATPGNVGKLQIKNVQITENNSVEVNSSGFSRSSASMSGCPRVFCLGTSGHVLLSNTGLLGILCSCHSSNMSVSKFCEHSGLTAVNPGDTVRMDSGETISQWRRLYFQKFGIRVPEDQSGWDWPEGLSSTAAALVKSSGIVPVMSNNSDLTQLVGSPGGFIRSGLPVDDIGFPNNHHTDQNWVIGSLHNKQERNDQDSGSFLLKGFSTCHSSTVAVVDNQIVRCPTSRSSTTSKLVGRGSNHSYPSLPVHMDSIARFGNLCMTQPNIQNSGVRGIKNAKDGVAVDSNAASSNIDLRLGQPYQQNRTPVNSVLPVIGSKGLDAVAKSLKPLFPEQMIHNAAKFREKEESRQYLHCTAGPSNATTRRERGQFNLGTHAFGIGIAKDAAEREKFKGEMAYSVSPILAHLKESPEGDVSLKAANNSVNTSKHIMSKRLHCVSHSVKSDPAHAPWSSRSNLGRPLNVSELGFFQHMDKGKGVGCCADSSIVATDSVYRVQKQMGNPSSFTELVGGSADPSFPVVFDNSCYSCPLPSVPPDAFDSRVFSNHPERVPCLGSGGHDDHVFPRSTGLPMVSGPILPSQAVSVSFPSSTSISIPGLAPVVLKQDCFSVSPYLLDENMRLLALGQILELSKQQHEVSTNQMNRGKGRFGDFSNANIQHSLVDLSTSAERRHGPSPTSIQGAADRMGNDIEKLAPVTGLNNWYDFSKLAEGISSCSKETNAHFQISHDPVLNERPVLRSENNTTPPCEHQNCCPRVPCIYFQGNHKCNCTTPVNFLGGNCDSTVRTCCGTFKAKKGGFNCEASTFVCSESVEEHILPKGKTVSLLQSGAAKGQLPKDGVCHTPQWRDVPNKLNRVCPMSADFLNRKENDGGQVGDTAAKCYNGAMQKADSLKEQEMSNISSGCSAPVVTQASIEVNNMDSSIVDAGDTGYMNNHIVDEGSGIDKCWSSDDALESERSIEFIGSTCKTNLKGQGASRVSNNQSSRSLLEELKLMDSLTWRKGRNQVHNELTAHGNSNYPENFARDTKTGKRHRAKKLKMLDASLLTASPSIVHYEYPKGTGTFQWPSCSSKDVQMLLPSGQETYCSSGSSSTQANSNCETPRMSLAKALSCKRDLEDDYQRKLDGSTTFSAVLEATGRKKFRKTSKAMRQYHMQETLPADTGEAVNCNSVGCMKASFSKKFSACHKKVKPIVCGKYGELSSGNLDGDHIKPVKIVPLSMVLETVKICTLPKTSKPKQISLREMRKKSYSGSYPCYDKFSYLQKAEENRSDHSSFCDEVNVDLSLEGTKKACTSGDKQFADKLLMLEKEREVKSKKECSILNSDAHAQLKPKCKEIRKRSLYELTGKGKSSSSESFLPMRISKCNLKRIKTKMRKTLNNAEDSPLHLCRPFKVNGEKFLQEHKSRSIMDSDAICCVCGSSNKVDINNILKCSQCLITVHQACYGVSRVPKGHWYCRPCKTSSKDMVCVLCGYGSGAMTRALRCRTIVKSLLRAWNIETEGPADKEPSAVAEIKMDEQNNLDPAQSSACCGSNSKLRNSITEGVLDSTVKQWVHMVCGLWTPGTRCPNVDTMSAFDVSGASHSRANVVCSMCNRPGGSCIQCRVVNCSIQFHPWCAHQKGLLQSEVEGVDNENVGFYGRCMLHAAYPMCESGTDCVGAETCSREELSCSRTEGYKGRKRDGFWHNLHGQSKEKGGCLVLQEQLNAWIHINEQKSSTQGMSKLPMSDIEYDCRKEYGRYKQAKGWKHLVVYKSGIHALGLYTSRFILRGEMVVEYVGEIVGLRVADKRENEYQSGRKLQYKSACYFFRIDKEHIIDATCKGGIARFVNHSCLPNCVAKVISIRNEKKVVFFAERDIYPGEEITYDYHFNHEDEGPELLLPLFMLCFYQRHRLNIWTLQQIALSHSSYVS
ncbi:SET domain-containing protein/PHD_2 domain-containing protein/zf-HC5HC2H_2 domain-containing protein [Cephalotus follicularis]|uniref:SET domain-containing protein/PHD_2 domain-containing protein/zf-HC5HC2H_2 domain-containing protein n=1 Tax=Cephalotus follicularis TaxID=3775 RepID=A0A1Q3AYB1_CEPFO|nr:SET domain-containing protein/PHD_2 domain-containing protein/zf-HC5HC2H_2 domain-containing protein [Cephalotus follicularis]